MNTETSSILKKIKRLTSGGRSLNAIHLNKKLNQIEKHLMLVLAGLLDFRGLDAECSFGDAVLTIPVNQIANRMSMTNRNVKTYITNLSSKGYVIKSQNFSPDDKRQLESTYMLTDQIFVEFAEELGLELDAMSSCGDERRSRGGCTTFTGGVNDVPYYLPSSLPDSNPEIQIPETNNFNDNEKICVVSGGEAYVPPKLTHSDTKQRLEYQTLSHENLNSSVQGDFDIEEIEFEKPMKTVNEQFNSRIVKAAQEVLNNKTPRVTPSHRKMVAVFRPKASLKSFVQDNDIHFMTDQVLEKYGDYGHVIIEYLYQNQIKYKKLGELAWNPNEVWRLIDTSKKLLDEEKENTHE